MKQLACLILLSLAITTFADDCNNPLLTTFKFEKYNTPQTVTGLKYCRSLQKNGNSCCSADVINSIQDKAVALAQKITGYVASRDQEIVKARETVLPALKDSFKTFKDSLTQTYATLDDMVRSDNTGMVKAMVDILKETMNTMMANIDTIYDNINSYKSKFADFQKYRSTCMVQVLKLQASSYCLACDPTYATKGVSGNTVTMSDRVCGRIADACYNYIDTSSLQNGMLYIKTLGAQLEAMSSSMAGGSVKMDLSSKSSNLKSLSTDKLLAVQPSEKPSGCSGKGNCKWACTDLFKNGQLSESLATLGGAEYSAPASRLLAEEEETVEKKQRRLSTNSWDPDEDESGVTVTFQDNPGNVKNEDEGASGSVLKVGMMCAIGMIVAILF